MTGRCHILDWVYFRAVWPHHLSVSVLCLGGELNLYVILSNNSRAVLVLLGLILLNRSSPFNWSSLQTLQVTQILFWLPVSSSTWWSRHHGALLLSSKVSLVMVYVYFWLGGKRNHFYVLMNEFSLFLYIQVY